MCNCSEGRFERTVNNYAERDLKDLHPHAKTFLGAKVGTVCLAPPVHDCTYIRVRNQLSSDAMRLAYEQTVGMKNDGERDVAVHRVFQTEIRRLIAEYYHEHK